MPLEVVPMGPDEMHAAISIQWDAFENPFQPAWRVFSPLRNNDRPGSIAVCAEGLALELKFHDAGARDLHWVKVVDSDPTNDSSITTTNNITTRIMGACAFFFWPNGTAAPKRDDGGDPDEAFWHPEGPAREFATQCFRGMLAPRRGYTAGGTAPHAWLYVAFTAPAQRRKGVARAYLEWGVKRCDELGLDCWVDSSPIGQAAYESVGFLPWGVNDVKPVMPEGYSEEEKKVWRQLEESILPFNPTVMWRPAGGKLNGRTKPWEEAKQ